MIVQPWRRSCEGAERRMDYGFHDDEERSPCRRFAGESFILIGNFLLSGCRILYLALSSAPHTEMRGGYGRRGWGSSFVKRERAPRRPTPSSLSARHRQPQRRPPAMTKRLLCYLMVAIVLAPCAVGLRPLRTPLDEYVSRADAHYRWYDTGERLTGFIPWEQWEGVVLNMTSQKWLTSADVDCSVWTHHLVIVRPGKYEPKKTALLIVGGGTNSGELPSAYDETLILGATVAVKTKSLVAVLYQVPNQPCHFSEEQPRRGRSEDDLIAYTWAHFLSNPNQTEWPLRVPMTKAVVRAMDTVQAFTAEAESDPVENFIIAGASKRGWTAWTTAAVDNRVVGIIPIVMDILNFRPNIHHFYRALGGWPVAFQACYEMNLTANLDKPAFQKLMDIVDPFQYKERLTMPKLLVTTSNDEFFLIDDSAYFWDELPGEKHMLILSNTEHTLLTGVLKLLMAVESFFVSVVHSLEVTQKIRDTDMRAALAMPGENWSHERRPAFAGRPKYWWHVNQTAGTIDIGTVEEPDKVILWYAYTTKGTKTRDFRWFPAKVGKCRYVGFKGYCLVPVFFRSRHLKPSLDAKRGFQKSYSASIACPEEGFGAFFVELRFAGPKFLMPFIFTTSAVVVPNRFPFEDCNGEGCKGTLV